MRRTLSILVAMILGISVVATVVAAARRADGNTRVRGVVDEELRPFFDDPAVTHAFAARGLTLDVRYAAGDALATAARDRGVAFVVTATVPAAKAVERVRPGSERPAPFFTPLVVVASKATARALEHARIVRTANGLSTFDLRRDLAAAPGTVPIVHTPDVASSSAGALYLAAAAAAANGGRPVAAPADVESALPRIAPLFVRQGAMGADERAVFGASEIEGSTVPAAYAVYESDVVTSGDHAKVMYLEPGAVASATVVSFGGRGDRIAPALAEDPAFAVAAVVHGYRTADPAALPAFALRRGIIVPGTLRATVALPEPAALAVLSAGLEAAVHRASAAGTP